MHFKLMFPSDYVGAHDLKGKDVTLEIASVAMSELRMQGGVKETKPVIAFKGAKKKLVLNKTNAKTIAKLHGTDTAGWIGNSITLYPTTTPCGRETVDCIRVREQKPRGNAPAASIDNEGEPASGAPSAFDLLVEHVAEHNSCLDAPARDALRDYCTNSNLDPDNLSSGDVERIRVAIDGDEVTV